MMGDRKLTSANAGTEVAFASRLRIAIADSGAKQTEIAKQVGGCQQSTLSKLVAGKCRGVAIDLLVNILRWADARGYSIRWLFTGLGSMRVAPGAGPGEQPGSGVLDAEASARAVVLLGLIKAYAAYIEGLMRGPMKPKVA